MAGRVATVTAPLGVAIVGGGDIANRDAQDMVREIKASPLLRKGVPVRGFVYEVETGRIRLVI